MSWLTLVTRVAGQSIVMAGGQRGRWRGRRGKRRRSGRPAAASPHSAPRQQGGQWSLVVTSGHWSSQRTFGDVFTITKKASSRALSWFTPPTRCEVLREARHQRLASLDDLGSLPADADGDLEQDPHHPRPRHHPHTVCPPVLTW